VWTPKFQILRAGKRKAEKNYYYLYVDLSRTINNAINMEVDLEN
jgi:hypothetical protein